MTLGDVLRGLLLQAVPVVVDAPVVFGCDAVAAAVAEAGMISCAFHNDRPPAEANHLLPGAGAGYVAIIVASTFRGEYDTAGTAAATAVVPLGRTDVVVDFVVVVVEEEEASRP